MDLHNLIGTKLKYAADAKVGFLVSFPEEIGVGGFGIEIEANNQKITSRTRYGSTILETINSAFNKFLNKH